MTVTEHKKYLRNSKKYLIFILKKIDIKDCSKKKLEKEIRLALDHDFTDEVLEMLTQEVKKNGKVI